MAARIQPSNAGRHGPVGLSHLGLRVAGVAGPTGQATIAATGISERSSGLTMPGRGPQVSSRHAMPGQVGEAKQSKGTGKGGWRRQKE